MALYVVTGGAGFIGSHIATALVQRGDRVRVVDDLSAGTLANLAHLMADGSEVELLRGDLLDRDLLARAVTGARGIFHQAAQVSVPASVQDPMKSYRTNVMGTLAVLEAARAAGIPKLVFAASSAAYGDEPTLPKLESMPTHPLSPYAAGKLAGETLLAVWGRCYGLATVALRYFNVYGPRQADDSPYSGVIALFARAVLARRAPTIFGSGEQSRDFVYVEDVARANLLAMDGDTRPGTVLNVGTGRATSVNEVFAILASRAGFEGVPIHAPARHGDVPHSVASIELARRELDFEPRWGLEEGLGLTLDWYRARLQIE